MSWTWRLEAADGSPLNDLQGSAPGSGTATAHASQSDAESWLGENWRALRDQGVAQVVLLDAGEVVYGPMSLSDG